LQERASVLRNTYVASLVYTRQWNGFSKTCSREAS